VSMAFGILVGSTFSILLLGISGIWPLMLALSFLGGMTWVVGNYLLIIAVANAGMARSFIVINFTAVLSFIGGIAFLGEQPDITMVRLALIAGAVGLVLLGSFLVTTTTPEDQTARSGLAGLSKMRQGLIAAFVATIFFSLYNVMIAYVINKSGTPASTAFISIAPGVVLGAVLVAFFVTGDELKDWKAAPVKWHLLAILQGIIWAAAMVCIMFGWMGTGIALGTPVQVGIQTLMSSLWGIAVFGEFRGMKTPRSAYARYAAGALLTIAGILGMALV
jgi:glucose uptake protein GlcU